jgi:hypothetical protein
VEIDTALLVTYSVSVWNLYYGKYWSGGSVDCYSDIGEC